MNKSIYSLVLSDEIVQEVDSLAYEMNTSRSNMINQILAEYFSYDTPEKRIKEVFDRMEKLLLGASGFQTVLQPSGSMYSIRSALSYKYNPSVRYSVELTSGDPNEIGELRVSVRSQNSSFILLIMQFFKLWNRVENRYIGETDAVYSDGRYLRKLRIPEGDRRDGREIGEAIAGYISALDRAMKYYFSHLTAAQYAVEGVERIYAEYLHNASVVLS